MFIRLQSGDDRPLYVQIMDEVRRGVVRGTVGPGDPLPSVREVAAGLKVNPRTVSQAYAELERQGVVHVRHGKGTFVADDIRPDRNERPKLAREVALRAMADASRNGLELEELIAALRDAGNGADPIAQNEEKE